MRRSTKYSKSERIRLMTEYIKEKGKVTRDELINLFDIEKQTLTGDLKEIRQCGLDLVTPPRSGLVYFGNPEDMSAETSASEEGSVRKTKRNSSNASQPVLAQQMAKDDFRQWFLIHLLSSKAEGKGMTIMQLTGALLNYLTGDPNYMNGLYASAPALTPQDAFRAFRAEYDYLRSGFSYSTLYSKDLQALIDKGWVLQDRGPGGAAIYRLSSTAPLLLDRSFDSLWEFCDWYQLHTLSSAWRGQLQPLYQRAAMLTEFEADDPDTSPLSERYSIKGKRNMPSSEELNRFMKYPYRRKMLRIPYRANNGSRSLIRLSVGMLIYSRARDQFYVIGEKRAELKCLRLSNIDIEKIEVLKEANTVFNSEKYQQMFREMFSVSIENPIQVKVRFQVFGRIKSKVEALQKTRPTTARIEMESEDAKEFIYTDTIRGMEDFAAYLRSYGRSALVVEPPALAERMQRTAKQVMEAYEKEWANAKEDEK